MSTKTDFPGQHTPLHQIYGQQDCCLCRLERENTNLRADLSAAQKRIESANKIIADAIRCTDELDTAQILAVWLAEGKEDEETNPYLLSGEELKRAEEKVKAGK